MIDKDYPTNWLNRQQLNQLGNSLDNLFQKKKKIK